MEKFIKVLGTGTLYARADTLVINLTITSRDEQYERVIESINKLSDELIAIISSLVSNEKIQISSFYVDVNYQQQDTNGSSSLIPSGYMAREIIKVEIPTDLVLLQSVMNAAIYSRANPEMSVVPSLTNKDTYINRAIVEAISDANSKANLISNTIGVKILNVQNIEYTSSGNIQFIRGEYSQLSTATGNVRDISLEPILIQENVIITYAI